MFQQVYRLISIGIGILFFILSMASKEHEKRMEHILYAIFALTASQI
jgi:hypothetical protein